MHEIPHSDSEMLRLLALGDERAFQRLFERYWDAVYSTSLALTKSAAIAEDIAQDVFTILWEKRAALAEVSRLEGYLFITARNLIYSRLRKLASGDAYRQYVLQFLHEGGAQQADHAAEFRELEQCVLTAIRQLPPQQQRAFTLSRFEGMRHEEIATTMGVSRITIKSYIVQAIASLRKALSNHPSGAMGALWAMIFFS
ncbi:RNA polymerase sigma factor [Chitinophaga sp.]|uniref:RNA polymerase sigma factor n=1 Tax=Chitinophaga sp. TaxID=1869181 RepID=UPI00260F4687|nr:RNA polymerase sigma-70 factor [uncultured Chitinophaga sp.]